MVRALLLVAVVLPLAGLSLGSAASAQAAPASKASLTQQLDRLNRQADQLVENYLQAKNQLDSTVTDLRQLQGRANQAQRDYNQLQAAVSAQWTAAYVRGTGTDIASLLGATDPTVALQRMQSLELLAQRDAETVTDLQAAKRSFESTRATLVAGEKKQAATVARLAADKAKVDAAVAHTKALLGRMSAAERARVDGGSSSSGGGSAPAPNVPVSGGAAKVIAWAKAHLGVPYQYGGAGPYFDCSGFTMVAWQQAGKSLPHSSAQQYAVTRRISRSQLQPGDLVFYYSPVSHVSIYLGGGMRIGETHTGSTSKIQPLGDSITGYGRVM
ncbi:MAG TPA: NlpC/P60 family protein [Actinomycetes bacterium]